MNRVWPMRRIAAALVSILFVGIATVWAQSSPAQTGFVPQESLPKQEIPATPLLYGAYAVVWGVLVVYLLLLWRRIARVEQELSDVNRKLSSK